MVLQKDNYINLIFKWDVKSEKQSEVSFTYHELHFMRTHICGICVFCDYIPACDGPFCDYMPACDGPFKAEDCRTQQ